MEFCGMFRMNCVPEGKTARVPLMSVFLLSLVLSLSGCIEPDKEKAIRIIKAESDLELHRCVGANGSVDYYAFKTDKKPDNFVVVNVTLKRNGEKFMIQNLFETNSQNYEAVYMEYNDEPATMFTAAFTLLGFCELSFM